MFKNGDLVKSSSLGDMIYIFKKAVPWKPESNLAILEIGDMSCSVDISKIRHATPEEIANPVIFRIKSEDEIMDEIFSYGTCTGED